MFKYKFKLKYCVFLMYHIDDKFLQSNKQVKVQLRKSEILNSANIDKKNIISYKSRKLGPNTHSGSLK